MLSLLFLVKWGADENRWAGLLSLILDFFLFVQPTSTQTRTFQEVAPSFSKCFHFLFHSPVPSVLSSLLEETNSSGMDNQLNIPLHESSVNIVSRCQTELREIIHHKFQCEATFKGVDFQGDFNVFRKQKAPGPPAKRFEVALPSGTRVSVWKGDLTHLKVDAVVNAANSQLQHGGGLAAAISKAGGPQIQHESDDYISKYGALPTGEAIMCDAGNLPCKKLIHAVGPHLPYRPQISDIRRGRDLLEKTITSILDIVEKHQLTTVAIPAICSGLFNYPLVECAETIVNSVQRYYKSSYRTPVEILLVNHDEPTVAAMMKACQQIIGSPSSTSYSQAVSSNTRSAANTSTDTVQIGNVLVTLKSDKIEEQKTDVIVNTASPNRDLTIGMISMALLKKAGHEMQKEISKAPKYLAVIYTKPYQLKCKEVFHTFCVEKSRRDGKKILFESVLKCLEMAVTRHHKSVAFPAIGTGALGFSAEEVASIMSKAVADFAPKCKIKFEVHFVIFPSDRGTFQAFQDEMRSFNSKQPTVSGPLAESKVDSPRKKGDPSLIILSGSSNESKNEAKRWLFEVLLLSPNRVVIQNNFIQHFSDRECKQLARLTRNGVDVEEFLSSGHACLSLGSKSGEDAIAAALQVEKMLQEVQETFVKDEVTEMEMMTGSHVSFARKIVDHSSREFLEVVQPFGSLPLGPIKVEKVENAALKMLFDLKKKQLKCTSTRKMYQCIPAQFCGLVSQIGFHAEVAPPEAPDFGEGIYFTATVKKAKEVWKANKEEYLYVVEAEVLEGSSTRGKPGLILPPVMDNDPQFFSSVNGGPEISVIFSGFQALPRYIITCGK